MQEINKKDENNNSLLSKSSIDSAEIYKENLVMNGRQGHGFAAEKANDLYDNFTGKNAKIVGADNKKNGPDRLVDGELIQTKYCTTGAKCIAEAFHNGEWRYWNNDGTPMQIEVPSDCYEDAIKELEKQISKGKLKGFSNPSEAKNIVRKGHFTYQQAKNIAKFGTVESLTFDLASGIKLSTQAMGLTGVITFAIGIWQGKKISEALEEACFNGICVGGVALISHVAISQIGKSGLDKSISPLTKNITKIIPADVKRFFVQATKSGSKASGASLNSQFDKYFRSNAIGAAVTITILSLDDFISLFNKEISSKQAFKNIAKTSIAVGGGALGAYIAISLVNPVAGSALALGTAVAGSIIGGTVSKLGGDALIDSNIQDDSVAIGTLIQGVFCKLSHDYILSEIEFTAASYQFNQINLENYCKSAYSSGNAYEYIEKSINSIIEAIVEKRRPIFLPSKKKINRKMSELTSLLLIEE